MTADAATGAALFARHVLKDGDTFLVANGFGDIDDPASGLFRDDTRVLSRYALRLGDGAPVLLGAAVTRDNVFFLAHLTNRALAPLGESTAPQGRLHLSRSRFLAGEAMHERLVLANYGDAPLRVTLRIELDADFRDMFEVRGSVRAARGERLPDEALDHGLAFSYRGLDGVLRRVAIAFSRPPRREAERRLAFDFELAPDASQELLVEVGEGTAPATRGRYRAAAAKARQAMRGRQRRGARLRSGGPLFDAWLDRSRADLALLTSELDTGPYPYAGIPWFSTPFGRDAVVTALQTLWLDPRLARGVLGFLAKHQAREESRFLDAAPGKIMHETRRGEMSALRELPFGLYYGGVDTTPLFVMLAGAYARRTAELDFIDALWPALLAATAWIERVCDASPFGLLDYARGESSGLANQGWKDSEDSVFHADGRFPAGPVALVEVQGYAFAALRAMAWLAGLRGDEAAAARWRDRAARLRGNVEARFWMPERGYYGIAVDGDGALCRVLSSNPGHLLYVGLPSAGRAAQVARHLLSPAFHSGWGVRTLARGEARFNPMSYHNGSVWPHDSALCAAGIAAAGVGEGAVRLLRAAFEAAVHFDLRVPELFCGFPRRQGAPPIAYPVACLPQAWAAGSSFMLAQACLGVSVDALRREVVVRQPQLPPGIDELRVTGLAAGERAMALHFRRQDDRVCVVADGGGEGWALSLRT